MNIRPGSVVILKSGGHQMVVEELGEHHDAKCIWFDEGQLREQWLALVVLTEVTKAAVVVPAADVTKGRSAK